MILLFSQALIGLFFFDKLEELALSFQIVLFLHIPVTFLPMTCVVCTGIVYLACRSGILS